jgi:tetratricopeptide (TPR) repeat protein
LVNSISNLAKKTWFLWSPVAWAIQTVTLIRTSNFIIEKFLTNEDIPKEGALYISMILALPYTLYLVSRIRNSQENFSIEEIISRLAANGFIENSSPSELTPTQEEEINLVLEMAEQLVKHGIEIEPWTEITLGNAAELAGRTHSAQQNYLRALELFRGNGDREGEGSSLNALGNIAKLRGDLAEAERLYRECVAIAREIGDRGGEGASLGNLGSIAQTRGNLAEAERLYRESLATKRVIGDREGEGASLNALGTIAQTRGDFAEAERLYRECLAIYREIGDREGEAGSLGNLGIIMNSKGQHDEERRMYTEAVRIRREIGIPIDQWFIDNGY